ncbi:putative damage-inducible protein DinB [Christiangramia gaetbulicola]|uniref:Putative damage-inducible protein DinB n=1 Tax=Christiangramia gaetbulicola TaxID=703340 RepID=A0A2T6ALY0_9FLAO|nr:DinB family protein [Christiangramia gaetbulicola]PTX44822.1 putative damage-inducible protein DinB [Christiangramia gaetbulicola]
METIKKQILETWFINHRTNLKLLNSITEESLAFTTSKRGGGGVGHQLAHLYNVRYWKLERFDKNMVSDLATIKASDEKTIPFLIDCHNITADLVAEMLKKGIENDGQVKGFKRGVVPLLGYFIHHEAHHRGNILLTLKRCSFKLPDDLKYGLWEWNKI